MKKKRLTGKDFFFPLLHGTMSEAERFISDRIILRAGSANGRADSKRAYRIITGMDSAAVDANKRTGTRGAVL